jgi:hypothetical protein
MKPLRRIGGKLYEGRLLNSGDEWKRGDKLRTMKGRVYIFTPTEKENRKRRSIF